MKAARPTERNTPAVETAIQYFNNGYHCSEAVVRAVLEALHGTVEPYCIRIANPFLGGMGRTKANACGAMTGALIVLGYQYGRTTADEDDNHCVAVTQQFCQRFETAVGLKSVTCQVLYDHRQNNSCRTYVANAVQIVLDLIEETMQPVPRFTNEITAIPKETL